MDNTEQPVAQESETPEAIETETPEALDTEVVEQAEDDSEEIEHDGEKYRLPKKLAAHIKNGTMFQDDYTRKTQSLSEQKKAVAEQETRVQQQAQEHEAFLSEVADVRAIEKQLKQFEGINWDQLSDADPVQAMKLDRAMRQLQSQRDQMAGALTQKQQQRAFQAREAEATQLEQARQALKREIPNWSPELAQTLRKHALDIGVPADALDKLTSHVPVKLLHDSYTLKQLMAKQTAKPKPEAQEKPVTRIAAVKNTATRDPDKLSPEEWSKWRNAQVRRNR
jgi:hypothetical protein